MAEEIEEDKFAKVKEALKPLTDSVNRIGLAKIILFVIIIAVGWWFITLPKPGTLFITVTELDGTQPIEGALVSLQWPDGNLLGDAFSTITDSSGVASFTNVPSGRDLTIVVEGTGEFESARSNVILASEESKSEVVKLPHIGDVRLSPSTLTGAVSETCIKEARITVTNNGANPVEAVFVGSGALETAISSIPITVLPGSSENASVFIDVAKTGKKKAQVLTGEIRLKGMNKKVNVNLQVGEAPKIDVSPASLSCAAGRPSCQQIVTIANNGASTLNNLKVEPSATVATVLENSDVERYYTTDSISPGGEAKFGTTIISTTAPIIGVVTVKADCFIKQIDVQVG